MAVTSIDGTKTTPTITIPVSAAWHVVVGVGLALISVAAFWVHFELPSDNSARGTTIGVGVVVGCSAMIFWLWCTMQRNRAETQGLRDDIEALREDLERVEGALTALTDCYLAHGEPGGKRTRRDDAA